jgi:signal transduction histidine kinase
MNKPGFTGLQIIFFLILANLFIYAQADPGEDRTPAKIETRIEQVAALADESPDQAIPLATELLKQLNKSEDKPNRAKVLKTLGGSHYNLGNDRQALEYYEQALIIYRELENKTGIGSVLNNIGLIREIQGDYSGALKRYIEASSLFTETRKDKYLALSLTNIGNVYYTLGRFDKALEYLTQALRINEKTGDSTGLSKSYNNIGNVYLSLKDYQIALDFYNKALAINKKRNNLHSLSTSYNNIGLVYQGLNKINQAIEYNRLALELSRKINDQSGVIHSLINSGNIYFDENNIDQALIYYQEALRISNSNRQGFTHATILQNLARLRTKQNLPDEAIILYKEALDFAEKSGSLILLEDIYNGLAEAWQKKGDYKRAYDFMTLYKVIADSVYNTESNDRLNRLRVSFESEQTERDNQLLRQQNIYSQLALKRQQTIRNLLIIISIIVVVSAIFLFSLYQSKKHKNTLLAERNEQIIKQKEELNLLYKEQYKLNETKNKFFSIVAHDLKSPFQSILGFSELLCSEYEHLDEDQRRDAANNILKVSGDTFRLIENLLEWGRSQTGGVYAVFKVFNIRELVVKTLPVFEPQIQTKKIRLTYDLPPLLNAWADPDMIMAVIRNLLSNAIKFTPAGGEIHLSATMSHDSVKLSVRDSGSGIPPDVMERLFTLDPKVQRAGTMGERGTGLGLTLCREFMELNHGIIKVESEAGKGSTFTIIMQPKHHAA